jgi:hypothetical protein
MSSLRDSQPPRQQHVGTCEDAFQARKNRYATPTYFNVWKASELAYNKAAPGDRGHQVRDDSERAAQRSDQACSASPGNGRRDGVDHPGPGVTTITRVVNKNATPTTVLWSGCREHTITVIGERT